MYNDAIIASNNPDEFQKHIQEEFGYTQDPNAQALEKALGTNAENYYQKDAPIAEAVAGGIVMGVKVGSVAYLGAASLYGAGSKAAIAGGMSGFVVGAPLGVEVQVGIDTITIKSFIKLLIKGNLE